MVQGQKILPHGLQDLDESSPLYEEVIAADGSLEEFFAFDNMWGLSLYMTTTYSGTCL